MDRGDKSPAWSSQDLGSTATVADPAMGGPPQTKT